MDNELNGNLYIGMARGGGRRRGAFLRDLLERLREYAAEPITTIPQPNTYTNPFYHLRQNDMDTFTFFEPEDTEFRDNTSSDKGLLDKKLSKINTESKRRNSKSHLNCEYMSTKQEIKASRIKEVLEQNKKLKALREKRREEADKRVAREFFDGLEVVGEESDVV